MVVFSCSTVSVGLSFVNGNLRMYPVLVWEDNTSPNSVVLALVIPTASQMFCTYNCTCTSFIPTKDTHSYIHSTNEEIKERHENSTEKPEADQLKRKELYDDDINDRRENTGSTLSS